MKFIASETKAKKKSLEQLLEGTDREKLQGTTSIIVKLLKKETPAKTKYYSNKVSYINKGLRENEGTANDITKAKAKTKAVWSDVFKSEEARLKGEAVKTSKAVKDHFDYMVRTFGKKAGKTKSISIPKDIF